MTHRFSNKLAFIIPTKDRRQDLHILFKSLQSQADLIDQLILVDGGDDVIEDLVAEYPSLPIDYIRCYPPGFTKQKNAGTVAIRPEITLVGYIDDDLELEPRALQVMMEFWEAAGEDLGGTSFHITNMVIDRVNLFTRLFGTNSQRQGAILPSGFNVVVDPVTADTEVEWLCGGATVWRRDIIDEFPHDEWFAGYGHMDDIDYSLSVGSAYRMFVLQDARCAHHEKPVAVEKNYAFGIYDTVNRHYLVKKYPEKFSLLGYYWATLGKFLGRLMRALLRRDRASWLRAKGYLVGLVKVVGGGGSS